MVGTINNFDEQNNYMLCREGNCFDIRSNTCTSIFKDMENQIECEELKRQL